MMNQRITVEVNKLPARRVNVTLFQGDTVARALVEGLGEDNYDRYSILVNGQAAGLNTRLNNGDIIVIAAQVKGN